MVVAEPGGCTNVHSMTDVDGDLSPSSSSTERTTRVTLASHNTKHSHGFLRALRKHAGVS
jgi:hypothetical protein